MSIEPSTLYVVATPIGNLGDITRRALDVLGAVDMIAAEDTRHSARLLRHFGIQTPRLALHEHNEREVSASVVARLRGGESVALICDAGTPVINDPGYYLVRTAREAGIRVVPIPGASALVSALSVSGLPSDRFVYEGFLPAKAGARRRRLDSLRQEPRTLIFYEAPHRIVEALRAMEDTFGSDREAVIARELTKTYETVRHGRLGQLVHWLQDEPEQQKGEFVVLIHGAAGGPASTPDADVSRIMRILLDVLPPRQAAATGARITGRRSNDLYQLALQLDRALD